MVLAFGCAVVVSGCAVDLVNPQTSDAQTSDAKPSAVPSVVASTAAESEDPLQNARRSFWSGRITATTDCPTGEIVISGEDQNVQITADCPRVVLRASDTNVIAQHVGTLVIEADADYGYVLVKSADTIDISGDFATVYWDEGSPGVTMAGLSTANPNPVKE
jgi:hypothetical protein